MERIAISKASRHLPHLLNRVARGESLIITRHGKPVARLVPVAGDRERANEAAARILERRRHLQRVSFAELMGTTHEGNRH